MPTAGSPALIPPVTRCEGGTCLAQSKARECVGQAQEGGYTHGCCLPGPVPTSLAPRSLQGYLGPQATVPQVQLWGSPLAQKAGNGHDTVGPARPQVEGILERFSEPMGA